jgi:two-component system, chemotaxis family, chemotaxis protein CheY
VHKKRILIIDDSAAMRYALRKLLETEEFTVCGEAEDGLVGIAKAKELSPDLIFLDFSMPRMNGAEAAPILKQALPNVPIILFTMHEEYIGKTLAAAHSVDRVLPKPADLSEILECVRSLLPFTCIAVCAASGIASLFSS